MSSARWAPVGTLSAGLTTIGLVVLGAARVSRSWPGALACILLVGCTLPGYLVATFVVAPAIVGYRSFDTTPWTETIVAACAVLAAVAMLVGAASAALRERPRPAGGQLRTAARMRSTGNFGERSA